MLKDIRIFSADPVWRKILTDLEAVVLDSPDVADVNLDDLNLDFPITTLELKAAILKAIDNTNILKHVFGEQVNLSQLQTQIVVWLYRTGGMSVAELKNVSGFAPNMTTHAVDTAIYQLRKLYGHDFILNKDGKYYLGKL